MPNSFLKTWNLFGVLVFPLLLSAQIANYPKYQKAIHQAEINLVRGEEEKALSSYLKILSASDGSFVKDVYNALVLASRLDKQDAFFTLLELLLPKGLTNEYILEEEAFSQFHDDVLWDDFLERNSKETDLNHSLRDTMQLLEDRDQLFRRKAGSYRVYADTIAHIDSLNIDYLLSLVEAGRFPGENQIGARNFRGAQRYDVIFLHYTQSVSVNPDKLKLTPVLLNLVLEGKILPNKCAGWLDSQQSGFNAGGTGAYSFIVEGKKSDFYFDKSSGRKRILLNEYRKLLHLESLEEYQEKVKYVILNPRSPFIFDVELVNMEVSREQFERLSAYMEKVE